MNVRMRRITVGRPTTPLCRICGCGPARHGRRDQRCGTCATYYHVYHRDRSEELIIRNNIRRFERALLSQ